MSYTKARSVSRNALLDAELPAATDTYTVISHGLIINNASKYLTEAGFNIVNEYYKCNKGGEVAQGVIEVQYGDDPDMSMMFAFNNSYDKSVAFKCAIGGYIRLNNSYVISPNAVMYSRKHTGTSDEEAIETIKTQVSNAKEYFKQLVHDKERMKLIRLTRSEMSGILGKLYFDLNLLTASQITMIKAELKKPSYKYDKEDTLWTLYNHILVSLDKAHPRHWMEQQKLIHLNLVTTPFNIGNLIIAEDANETLEHEISDESEVSQDIQEESNEEETAVIQLPTVEKQEAETSEEPVQEDPKEGDDYMLMEQDTVFELYPDAEIGDTVTLNDMEFVIEDVDGDHFVLDPVIKDSPEIDGIPNGLTMSDTDDEEVMFDELEEPEEEEIPEDETHGDVIENSSDESSEDDQDDPVYNVIKTSLEELYGFEPEFTYELESGQYNVTLDTGEVVVFLEEDIDSEILS